MHNQPQGIQPGIYFNLSSEDYHKDPAIGCSNIKDLLVSPLKYWARSSLNPKYKNKGSKSKTIGTALHCYLMEREKFQQEYIVLPYLYVDSEFYRQENIKPDFAQNFSLRKTKDAKTFEYTGNKTVLKEEEFEEIKEAVEYFESLPTSGELFKDGYAEISIFWRDEQTGLMCKCRPDYLTSKYIADYKSIASIDQIKSSIANYEYYLQQVWYLIGLNELKKFYRSEKMEFKSDFMIDWWKRFIETEHNNFIFAFQEKEAPYLVRLKTLSGEILEFAEDKLRKGLEIYKENIEKFGINRWEDNYERKIDEGDIEILGFDELPAYIQYK